MPSSHQEPKNRAESKQQLRKDMRVQLAAGVFGLLIAVVIALFAKGNPPASPAVCNCPYIPFQFANPIEVQADSYPVHPDQPLLIQPKGKLWSGKQVKFYLLRSTDATTKEKMMKQNFLPPNAQWIGTAPIQAGRWSFQWKAPSALSQGLSERNPFGGFMVIAQSDEGALSAVQVDSLLDSQLALSKKTAKTGQPLTVHGAGFTPNSNAWIRLEQNGADDTGRVLADFGTVPAKDGSFTDTITLPATSVDGKPILPGDYQVAVVIIPPNQARQAVDLFLKIQ